MMELLVFLECLVQREKWEQEEIWVLGALLVRMVFKVLLVLKERKEELEMLESQDNKDKRETQDLLVKWVHLESKEHLVYLDSLDNRVFQVYLVIR